MKKRNAPGCPCCEVLGCDTSCSAYKCIGIPSELPDSRCPFPCGIRIDMPAPSNVNALDGPGCLTPGIDCPTSAPCNACYKWDQTFIYITPFNNPSGLTPGIYWNLVSFDNSDCNNISWVYNYSGGGNVACWDASNSLCPDEWPEFTYPEACGSEYTIRMEIRVNSVWDGSCGYLSVKLVQVVTQLECVYSSPLPPPIETEYIYEFRRNWCSCLDLFGALSYIGVTVTPNERGITVPDPCNLASAVVTIPSGTPYDPEGCGNGCQCVDCPQDYNTATISGPIFNGTIILNESTGSGTFGLCNTWGTVSGICDGFFRELSVGFAWECLDCNYYRVTIWIGLVSIRSEPFQCGDSPSVTFPIDPFNECSSGHTVTIVP